MGFSIGAPSASGGTSNGPCAFATSFITGALPLGVSTMLLTAPPHAPSHTTLPTSACCRAVSCCVRTSGNAAPMATGMSLCPVSSSMRSVCCVSSSRQALPVTMVMPSTWACGDCNNASMAIWFEPPGPEPS